MVYNAMKLFMEVNPQLFDDCSHEYAEAQNNADARQQARQSKWDRLEAQAKSRQNGHVDEKQLPMMPEHGTKMHSQMRSDDVDPYNDAYMQQSRRFETLSVQDESTTNHTGSR